MKVMFVSHSSNLCGAEQSLIDILKYIKKEIYPVVILPSHGDIEQVLNNLCVKYYIFDYPNVVRVIGDNDINSYEINFVKTYETAQQIVNIIRNEQIDLVHTNSTVVDVGAIAAIIAQKPHIWHFREFMEEDFNLEFPNNELKTLMFKNSFTRISISKSVQEKYMRMYGVDSIQIYDGIDSQRFLIDNNVKRNRKFYVAGAIVPHKGQIDAIKAVEYLNRKGMKDIELYLVGSISELDKKNLERYIKEHNLTTNIIINDFSYSLTEIREKCFCSITSSRMEALGRITVEAMMADNLVIGADTGGTKEIIGANEEYGFLYKQGNPESLAAKMQQAMELSETEMIHITRKAKKNALQMFDTHQYAMKLIDIYRNILKYKINYSELLDYIQKQYYDCKIKVMYVESKLNLLNEKTFLNYFIFNNISSVAVYGYGCIGNRLIEILESENIKIDYVVDQNKEAVSNKYTYYSPDDSLPQTQAFIISIAKDKEVFDKYSSICDFPVLRIPDIVLLGLFGKTGESK